MTLDQNTVLLTAALFAFAFALGQGLLLVACVVFFHYGSSVDSRTMIARVPPSAPQPVPPVAPVPTQPSPPFAVPLPAQPLPSPVEPAKPTAIAGTKTVTGKVSEFGGPKDTGVKEDEGLALVEISDLAHFHGLFLAADDPRLEGATGLARRLNPDACYIAMRWDYHETPKAFLQSIQVQVSANGKHVMARPVDWGPNVKTGRVADLSPGVLAALGLKTDDTATILYPLPSIAAAQAGAPTPTGIHVHAMAQTQAQLESVFGKFTYTEGSGGDINIDQAWVSANIVSVDIPQLHKFTKGHPIECHRLIAGPLKAAFADIEARGLLPLVLAYDGLWVPRHKGHDPSRGISLHSWGAAIDINADWNPYGGPPAPLGAKGSTVALISSFEAQGFAWGGYFHAPYCDSMHFEYARSA
jgi:hypothetical protein